MRILKVIGTIVVCRDIIMPSFEGESIVSRKHRPDVQTSISGVQRRILNTETPYYSVNKTASCDRSIFYDATSSSTILGLSFTKQGTIAPFTLAWAVENSPRWLAFRQDVFTEGSEFYVSMDVDNAKINPVLTSDHFVKMRLTLYDHIWQSIGGKDGLYGVTMALEAIA